MDEGKEKLEETVRTVERGEREETPFLALGGVTVIALGLAGAIAGIALVVWAVVL